jgi:hypothetical protein
MAYWTPNRVLLWAGLNGSLLEVFQSSPINYWGPVQVWILKIGMYKAHMLEIGFQDQQVLLRSRLRARDASPNSVIFTLELNFI